MKRISGTLEISPRGSVLEDDHSQGMIGSMHGQARWPLPAGTVTSRTWTPKTGSIELMSGACRPWLKT